MNRKLTLLLLLMALLNLGSSCKERKKVVKTSPVVFVKEGELRIYRSGTDSLLTRLDIEIADSDYETQTGLMYRDALEPDQGMLFVFPETALHTFYMKNTKITLDLLFIDDKMKIVHLEENAQPLDESGISSRMPVNYVLEVNSGLSQRWGLQHGDSIVYRLN